MIKALNLQYLEAPLNGKLSGADVTFSRVSTDTRSIEPGDLFVALKGERFDAHEFLLQAFADGAAAAIVEQLPELISDRPCLQVVDSTRALGQLAALSRKDYSGPLLALTGSCGKTTVKAMLASVLSEAGCVHCTPGNLNNHIGVPQTLLAMPGDTEFAVIEMGASGVGEIDYLAKLAEPTVALVNNVMAAHLEGFGSEAGVAAEKSCIYQHLRQGGTAVINQDEPYAAQWRQRLQVERPDVRILTFSVTDSDADIFASQCQLTREGCYQFQLHTPEGCETVSLSVMGRQNIANALAAASCALAAGVGLSLIPRGLKNMQAVNGRLQSKAGQGGALIIDDSYNANPGSVLAAAAVLQDLQQAGRECWLVLGDLAELGDDAEKALIQLGHDLQPLGIGHLLTCGNNSQNVARGWGGATADSMQGAHFFTQEELIENLQQHLTDNTVVLVKGSRSARMERVVQALTSSGEQQ